MSTWSGMRNKLENDYLCPALRGHIQYFATSYSKSADHEGRAAIRMDGVEAVSYTHLDVYKRQMLSRAICEIFLQALCPMYWRMM